MEVTFKLLLEEGRVNLESRQDRAPGGREWAACAKTLRLGALTELKEGAFCQKLGSQA